MVGGRIIVPHRRRILRAGEAGADDPWASWDETSEAGLASDDIFVCFFENPSAGGDETGQGGGLSGSDLVLTQTGDVAGATGSPPKRYFDGTNDYFAFTKNLMYNTILGSTWTIIIKFTDYEWVSLGYWFGLVADNVNLFIRNDETASKPEWIVQDKDGVRQLNNMNTSDAIPGTGDVYIAAWQGAGHNVRAGFTVGSKPTKWSDFETTKRVEGSGSSDLTDSSVATFTGQIGFKDSYYWKGSMYYVVLSSTCLIDNDS